MSKISPAVVLALWIPACQAPRPAATPADSDGQADAAESDGSNDGDWTDQPPADADADGDARDAIFVEAVAIDSAVEIPDSCRFAEMTVECEPREEIWPPMVHADCGPDAREIYLERGVDIAGSLADQGMTVWGTHAWFYDLYAITAVDLADLTRRTVTCEWPWRESGSSAFPRDDLDGVYAAWDGDSVLVKRIVHNETAGCPYWNKVEFWVFDWLTGTPRLVRTEVDDLPRGGGGPCDGGISVMTMDVYGDVAALAMIGHDCRTAVYTLDLTTGELLRWVDLFYSLAWVSIWEDRLAYATAEVRVLDLRTGEITLVTDDPGEQTQVQIWEDRVVWMDRRGGPSGRDIYWHDLSTGETHPVSTRPGSQSDPLIFGDTIVFQNADDMGDEIWMFDIPSGTERPLTFTGLGSYPNVLWEDRLYFIYQAPELPDWRPVVCEMELPST